MFKVMKSSAFPKSYCALIFCFLCIPVEADPAPYGYFVFTKVADTNTAVPDGIGKFDGVGRLIVGFGTPAIDGNNVAFEGMDGATFKDGIYVFDGVTLSKIVDENTPVPENPSTNFVGFDHSISLEGNTVAFEGYFKTTPDISLEGVYTSTSGTLTKVADTVTTTIPGSSRIFRWVDQPALSVGKVAFNGEDAFGFKGIYSNAGGALTTVVDGNTLVPGQAVNFAGFDPDVSLEGSIVAFEGHFDVTSGSVSKRYGGVYVASGGIVTKIADTLTTYIPSKAVSFAQVEEPAFDNGNVVFGGADSLNNWGIYTTLGGTLRVVADTNTIIPGGSISFRTFDKNNYSIKDDKIVFEGYYDDAGLSEKGLYFEMAGTLYKIIDTVDSLDGKDITNLDISLNHSLSGNRVAFRAIFVDASVGIYVADVTNIASDTVTFTRIADSTTTVPGGAGNFYASRSRPIGLGTPVIDGNSVAFEGIDDAVISHDIEGLYISTSGVLSTVVDEHTAVAGNPLFTYTGFNRGISLEGTTVGFEGYFNTASEGVYTATAMVPTMVTDTVTTTVPGTPYIFSSINGPALSGGKVAFKGISTAITPSIRGIYTNASGTLQTVVDRTTTVPGQAFTFLSFDPDVSMDGLTIAFEGYYNDAGGIRHRGAYTATGSVVTKVADTITTFIPGTATLFSYIEEPAVSVGHVVFGGQDGLGNWGIFTNLGGTLRAVANINTTVPGGSNFFTNFDNDDYAIDGNNIVFEGYSYGSSSLVGGLYLEKEGALLKIIDTTDLLDGKVISDLDIVFDRAISGNKVAFRAAFSDGSVGIFVASPCNSCADLYSNGIVDYSDLGIFADNLLQIGTPGEIAGDLNCDGRVDFLDFSVFSLQWLASCP